jgi:hypothetical protein
VVQRKGQCVVVQRKKRKRKKRKTARKLEVPPAAGNRQFEMPVHTWPSSSRVHYPALRLGNAADDLLTQPLEGEKKSHFFHQTDKLDQG